jgi:hypothetical protein
MSCGTGRTCVPVTEIDWAVEGSLLTMEEGCVTCLYFAACNKGITGNYESIGKLETVKE